MSQLELKYPFTNLIFEGGGVLGIAYLGMLDELDRRKILSQIKRVGGSSAGAITSLVVAFGLNSAEIEKIAGSLDYSKVPGVGRIPWPKSWIYSLIAFFLSIGRKKKITAQDIYCLWHLIHFQGWYSSDYFYKWLQDVIAEQFDSSKKQPPYTFKDFQDATLHKNEKKFLDLYVTGADISTHQEKIFSFITTPDVEVATAVRISMSIPLFFTPVELQYPGDAQKSTFSDGGTMLNYPISLFDAKEFGGDGTTNYHTLGGHLFYKEVIEPQPIVTLEAYVKNYFISTVKAQSEIYNYTPEDSYRTIDIDSLGVSFVDFQIKPHDETYQKLYKSGKDYASDYLDNYPSAVKPDAKEARYLFYLPPSVK